MATKYYKSSTSRMLHIDGEKLRRELDKRGLLQTEASRGVGCCDSYISVCIKTNGIARQTAKVLEVVYGIKTEDILPDTEVKTANRGCDETPADNTDSNELYDVIFKAIKDAFVWYANQGR